MRLWQMPSVVPASTLNEATIAMQGTNRGRRTHAALLLREDSWGCNGEAATA